MTTSRATRALQLVNLGLQCTLLVIEARECVRDRRRRLVRSDVSEVAGLDRLRDRLNGIDDVVDRLAQLREINKDVTVRLGRIAAGTERTDDLLKVPHGADERGGGNRVHGPSSTSVTGNPEGTSAAGAPSPAAPFGGAR